MKVQRFKDLVAEMRTVARGEVALFEPGNIAFVGNPRDLAVIATLTRSLQRVLHGAGTPARIGRGFWRCS